MIERTQRRRKFVVYKQIIKTIRYISDDEQRPVCSLFVSQYFCSLIKKKKKKKYAIVDVLHKLYNFWATFGSLWSMFIIFWKMTWMDTLCPGEIRGNGKKLFEQIPSFKNNSCAMRRLPCWNCWGYEFFLQFPFRENDQWIRRIHESAELLPRWEMHIMLSIPMQECKFPWLIKCSPHAQLLFN